METRKQTQKRRKLTSRAESGQTIIFMAVLMAALLGMLGLAIDGGRMFFASRDAQNAVDAALKASTYALCTGGDPEAAAHKAMNDNGFAHNGDDVRVVVAYPALRELPDNVDLQNAVDIYVTVGFSPYFIQYVYDEALEITASGVGVCEQALDSHALPGVYAETLDCNICDGKSSGKANINWTGGNGLFTSEGDLFFSNGDIFINGNNNNPAILDGDIYAFCDTNLENNSKVVLEEGTDVYPNSDPIEPPVPYTIQDFMPGGYLSERAINNPDLGIYYALTPETCSAGDAPSACVWYDSSKEEWKPEGAIEGMYYVEGDVTIDKNPVKTLDTDADANSEWDGVTIAATGGIKVHLGADAKYYSDGIIFFSDFNPISESCGSPVEDDGGICEGLLVSGTEYVTINPTYHGGDSYFNTTLSNAGGIDGTYDGWCVDVDHGISPGNNYSRVNVYSSYDPNLPALQDHPDKLPLVNYIINQDYPDNGYTFGDVQRAIWTLIDNRVSTSGLRTWSQDRVNEILADAQANGQGYIPGCNDDVAIIVQPVSRSGETEAQITIVEIPVSVYAPSCTCPEEPKCELNCSSNETGVFANGENNFTGVIIAPHSGVHFSGPDTTFRGAIFAQFVDMSGSNIIFHAEPGLLPSRPPKIYLAE
jgi:hypothetical protein